jgi:hypothetical protein
MNEKQWSACTSPEPMLDFLRANGFAGERKLRLFATACCLRAWHLLDAEGQAVVEALERFSDGLVTEAELRAAVWASRGSQHIDARTGIDSAAVGAWRPAVALLAAACGQSPGTDSSAALAQERAAQAVLLRCVLGPLPFRTVGVDPSWQTPLILSLAQAAYEERVAPDPRRPGRLILDPARLLVLADALEEAGCGDADILGHLRGVGPHARGCWPLDALLNEG